MVCIIAIPSYFIWNGLEESDSTASKTYSSSGASLDLFIKGLDSTSGNDAILSARWLSRRKDTQLPWQHLAFLYAAKGGKRDEAIRFYFLGNLLARMDSERCGGNDPQELVKKFELGSGISMSVSAVLLDDPSWFASSSPVFAKHAVEAGRRFYDERGIATWLCPPLSPVLSDADWKKKIIDVENGFVRHWSEISKTVQEAANAPPVPPTVPMKKQ